MSVTYITGEIELNSLPNERRLEIKKILESFYGSVKIQDIYQEDFLSFDEEWHSHEDTDNFMQLLLRVIPLLDKNIVSRMMCEGETHNDYWSIIIKRGKLYIQRYRFKPVGDKKEFVYSPV